MKKHMWLVALATGFIGLSSCSSEDVTRSTEPSNNSKYTIVEGTGDRVTLEFSGDADLEAFGARPESARYLLKGDGTQPRTAPVINLDDHVGQGNAKTLLIRLVDKNNPTLVTERIVTADELLFKGSEGKYTFEFKIDVTLQAGQSFESGEWYISGIYGGTASDPTNFEVVPRFVTNTQLANKIDLNENTTNGASLVIPWTRIYTKASPHPTAKGDVDKASMDKLPATLGRNFELKLKPDGVLFRIRPVSRLVSNILYNQIRVKTSDITIGTHNYEKPTSVDVADLTSGAFPKVTSTSKQYISPSLERVKANYAADQVVPMDETKKGFLLPSGDFGRAELLVWGFPVDGQDTDQSKTTELWVHSSGRSGHVARSTNPSDVWGSKTYINDDGTDNGAITSYPEKDIRYARVSTNLGNAGIQDNVIAKRWGAQPFYQKVVKQKYQRGRAYLMLPVMDSDLIMTERYSELQEPSVAQRAGLIEIYNPTLRPIDVSQYGFVRVAATGMENETNPDIYGSLAIINKGKLYAFPNVSEPLISGYGFKDQTNAFSEGATATTTPTGQRFRHAVVLPFSSALPSRTTGLGITGTNSLASNPNDTRANIPKVTYYASEEKGAYTVSYRDFGTALGATAYNASGSNILEPGQTMIVLSNKFLDAGTTAADIPFAEDIRKAATQGYCKYVVALNNAQDETAIPLAPEAGVMTLGSYDIPVLVKKRTGSAGEYYHIVDGLWAVGVNSFSIAGYLGYTASDITVGLFGRYVDAKNQSARGLWEKRSVGGAIFNYPIGYSSEQTEAQPYTPGTNDFASFGVLLFEQQNTPRNAANYVIKWTK